MPSIFERFPPRTMGPDDVYIVNDPYNGGTHLPDIFLVQPVFRDGAILALAAACVHVPDIGGRVPGGNASNSTEISKKDCEFPLSNSLMAGG